MPKDKKKALQIIVKAAEDYEKYLNNKHLTGVTTKLSAQRFYQACLCGKLADKDFEIDKSGKVRQKLMALPYLHNLLYHPCWIGNFINSGVVIRSDYFIGDTKSVVCVGFRFGKTVDMPVTLYREDVRKMIQPVKKILVIFAKRYNEKIYSECTYLAKGHCIDEFKIILNVTDDICQEKEEVSHGKQNQSKTVK